MLVKTLDDFEYKWSMTTIEKSHKSSLHKNAAVLIRNIFPTSTILEEVQFTAKKNKHLYLDFFIIPFKIAIEIDGEQHETYSNFFSKNPFNFMRQKINDRLKQEWCTLNNITLIRLKHNEQPNEWREKLILCGNDKSNEYQN